MLKRALDRNFKNSENKHVDFLELGNQQRKDMRKHKAKQVKSGNILMGGGSMPKNSEYSLKFQAAEVYAKPFIVTATHQPMPKRVFLGKTTYQKDFDSQSHIAELTGQKLIKRYRESKESTLLRS